MAPAAHSVNVKCFQGNQLRTLRWCVLVLGFGKRGNVVLHLYNMLERFPHVRNGFPTRETTYRDDHIFLTLVLAPVLSGSRTLVLSGMLTPPKQLYQFTTRTTENNKTRGV